MYLKSIKANGFKSFADKTEIEFKEGITAIIGPNGSGKSNIVDAVRWVLGEQSAKSLRATTSLSDVIFTGSKTREGGTRASVALTFDNTDNYLNSELSEIEIKRVVYLSGENEYYLNGVGVRLKDITSLFIDSGASKESFNIISQGAITDVINSKPEERRAMFESAAGVLKYKKRKEESLNKLSKTKDNLERIDLLLTELDSTVTPLKEQAQKAKKHLELKSELESVEIALMASDIKALNGEYQDSKSKVESLTDEIAELDSSVSVDMSTSEKEKLNLIKLETKINSLNEELLLLTTEIAELDSKKQIIIERKKLEVDDERLQSSMVLLKEEELVLKKNIATIESEITILTEQITKKEDVFKNNNDDLKKELITKSTYSEKINDLNRKKIETKQQITLLEDAIESDTRLPYAVRNVLNNPRLKGVHNIIGHLLEMDATVSLAIDTSLGYSANIIVVDNETSAKECINYLKENHLGRATFFPLNIIKSKYIEPHILERVSQVDGFVGVASSLVTYDKQYADIIENQLGNVMVVKDIDALNLIGRIIDYRYKIVSLTGEILHTGGSITGGSEKNNSGIISSKFDLEKLISLSKNMDRELKEIEDKLKNQNELLRLLENNDYSLNKDIIDLKETLNRKQISKDDLTNQLSTKTGELKGTKNSLSNSLDDETDKILEKYYKKVTEKDLVIQKLSGIKDEKNTITDRIQELDSITKKINSDYNKKQNELKNLEINLSKMDVRLDNLLVNLSENYGMTYEKAIGEYELDMDSDIARTKVATIKTEIKLLGDINTGAIAEYDRLNTRYEFLAKQKEDIEVSISNLLGIIEEMDEIMKQKFADTFEKIKIEFGVVFKELFKGGEGVLELTNPDNLLGTGIEIIAMPPGKKLNSITLLSGGEKALTAIALLFAIINLFPMPFCILDEVEAALDEANVDTFGNYLEGRKNLSQFIIITHKKKTMEYADSLYGITMQESGVSKLVSVELSKI